MEYILSEQGKEIQQDVKLTDIELLADFQPRKSLDFALVESLRIVEHIPAIKLGYFPEKYGAKLILIVGNHRFHSRQSIAETINANIFEYKSDLQMFKEAAKANMNHGKMLTKEEKQASIARIIECIPDEEFSATILANELGGQCKREIRKIYCWTKVKKIIGAEKAAELNISKADILSRLLAEGMTAEEFIEFYETYKTLTFGDLNNIINSKIKGELIAIDARELAIEKIDTMLDVVSDLEEELNTNILGTETDEELVESYILEASKETDLKPEVLLRSIFGETRTAIKTLRDFKEKGKFENSKELFKEEITKLKEEIKELEESIGWKLNN